MIDFLAFAIFSTYLGSIKDYLYCGKIFFSKKEFKSLLSDECEDG